MLTKTVLLSGATGFLGSHLAEYLSTHGYRVIALIRPGSNLEKCKEFSNNDLLFINTDKDNIQEELRKYKPECFIHAAWQGVNIEGRNNPDIQNENIILTSRLLTLAQNLGIKKIIALGSQAEYGIFNGRISEVAACTPVSAYGTAKLQALQEIRSFCESQGMKWFWIRIFSIYGTREKQEWLFPTVIRNLLQGKPVDLTPCEQRYDYLYAKDFCRGIMKVMESDSESGIFNLSSNSSVALKDILEKIKNVINPAGMLNFGAIPYRKEQIMHIEGDSTKFNTQFHFQVETDFDTNLAEMARYYRKQR